MATIFDDIKRDSEGAKGTVFDGIQNTVFGDVSVQYGTPAPKGWVPTSVPNDKPQTDYGSRLLGSATGLSAGHSQEKGLGDLIRETLTTREGLARLPIVGGLMEIGDSAQILNAAKAIEAGTADAQQQQVFDDYVSRQIEKQARGTSTAYEIADIIAMIPGFALEFAMTGGSFAAGRAAAKKTMEAAMKKTLGKRMAASATARGAAHTAGFAGGVIAQQGTLPTRAIANVIERQAPSVQLQVNQQGDPSGYSMEPGEGLGEAIPKGILDDTIEMGSERAGALLGPLAKIVSKPKAVKRLIELLEKTPMSAAARAKLGAAFERAGVHSPFGESFEERVGDVARDVTGVSDQPSDLTKMVTGRSDQPGQTPGQVRIDAFTELAKQTAKEVAAFAVPGMAGSAYERITRPRTDREVRSRAKVLEEGLRYDRLDRETLNHIVTLINHEKSGLRGTPEGERLLRLAAQKDRSLGKNGPNLMGAEHPEAQPPHPAGPGSSPTPPTGPGGVQPPSQTVRQSLGLPVQPVIPVPGEATPAPPSGASLQPQAPVAQAPPVQPTGQTLAPTNPIAFGQGGATVSRAPAPDPQAQLSALGWTPAQIAAMKPEQAARVIQVGMRPEQMPPASQPPVATPATPAPAPVPPPAQAAVPEPVQAAPAPVEPTPAPAQPVHQAAPVEPVNQGGQAQPEIQVITEKPRRQPPKIDAGKSLENAVLSLGGINPARVKKAGTEAEWKALPASLRRRIMRKDSTNGPDDLASQLSDLGYADITNERELLDALKRDPKRGANPGEMSDKEYWKAYEEWLRDKEDSGVSEPSGKYAASGRRVEGREIRTPAGRKYINGEEYFLMPFPELGRGASAWVKAANYPDGKKRTTRGFVEESAPEYGKRLAFPALADARAKKLYNKGKIYHDQALDLPAGNKRTLLLARADELKNQAAAILDQSREDPMTAAEYRERVQTLESERQAIIDKYRSRGGKPWDVGAIKEADALRINSLDIALSNLRAKAKSMVRAEAPKGQVVPMKRPGSAVLEPSGSQAASKPKPVDKTKRRGVKGKHDRRKEIEAALDALAVRDPVSAISGASTGFRQGKRSLLGLAIRPFLRKGRRIDVRGEKIKTLEDAVAVGRLFRNPQFETFHYVFVKAGKIVAHESVSSGLPGFSKTRKGKNDAKALWKLRSRVSRIDHDAVYLFHNHPLGDVTASPEDRQFTVGIARHLPKFAGHIIIDHTEYSIIGSDGKAYEHIWLDNPKPDFDRTPLVDSPGLQERVQDGDAVARWGRKYAHPDGDAVTVLYLSSAWKVHGIEAVPIADVSNGAKFAEWLKGRGRIYASTRAILYYNDRNGSLPKTHEVLDAMTELVKNDVVTDGIVDSQDFGLRSARPLMWHKQGFQFGRTEEDIDRGTVVREDSPLFRPMSVESFADANAQAEVDRRARFVRDSIQRVLDGPGTWSEKRKALGLEGTALSRYPNVPISPKEVARLFDREMRDTVSQTGLKPTITMGAAKEAPKPKSGSLFGDDEGTSVGEESGVVFENGAKYSSSNRGPIDTQGDFERQYAALVKKLEADRQYRRWGKIRDYVPLPGDAGAKDANKRPTLFWRSPNNVLKRMGGKYAEIADLITEASRARKAAKLGKHFFGAQHFDDIANEIVKEARIKRGSQEDEMVRDLLDTDFTGLTPDALRADKSYQGDKEAAIKAADRLRKEVFDPIIAHIRGDAELSAIIGTKGYIRGYFPHYFDTMRTKYGEKNAVQMMRLLLPGRFASRFLEERKSKDWASGVSIFDVLPAYIQSTAKTIHDIPAYDKARRLLDEIPEGDGIEKKYIEWYLNNYMGIKANPFGIEEFHEDSRAVKLSRKVAQLYYDNLIGLNPKTWIVNLTQPLTNTVPEIGLKYTMIGAKQLYTSRKRRKIFHDSGLLLDYPGMESGIMSEGAWRRLMHQGMSAAEYSNRGITYLAGLAKAKDMGLIGPAAEMYAMDLVDKTQFSYGPEGQSRILSAVTPDLRVFQTFKLKQTEFVRNLVADAWAERKAGEGVTTARKKLGTFFAINVALPTILKLAGISLGKLALDNLGFTLADLIPGLPRTGTLLGKLGTWAWRVSDGQVKPEDIPMDVLEGLYNAFGPGAAMAKRVRRMAG